MKFLILSGNFLDKRSIQHTDVSISLMCVGRVSFEDRLRPQHMHDFGRAPGIAAGRVQEEESLHGPPAQGVEGQAEQG